MENKAYFGSLIHVCRPCRESVLDQKPYTDGQRAVLAAEAHKANL